MKLTLYLLRSTDRSLLLAATDDPACPRSQSFWVPRSVIPVVTKHPAEPNKLPKYVVEIQSWWLRKQRQSGIDWFDQCAL